MVSAGASDPLFTLPKGKCITYPTFQKKLKSLIVEIGLDPDEYSTHSFRRRGTTTVFKAKVPIVLIDKLLVSAQMKQTIMSDK